MIEVGKGEVRSSRGDHTCWSFIFFNDTANTEIYTLSLQDALPILNAGEDGDIVTRSIICTRDGKDIEMPDRKSHTSELQSLTANSYAVFCLKNKTNRQNL